MPESAWCNKFPGSTGLFIFHHSATIQRLFDCWVVDCARPDAVDPRMDPGQRFGIHQIDFIQHNQITTGHLSAG